MTCLSSLTLPRCSSTFGQLLSSASLVSKPRRHRWVQYCREGAFSLLFPPLFVSFFPPLFASFFSSLFAPRFGCSLFFPSFVFACWACLPSLGEGGGGGKSSSLPIWSATGWHCDRVFTRDRTAFFHPP